MEGKEREVGRGGERSYYPHPNPMDSSTCLPTTSQLLPQTDAGREVDKRSLKQGGRKGGSKEIGTAASQERRKEWSHDRYTVWLQRVVHY